MAMKVINLVPVTSKDYSRLVNSVQQEFIFGQKLGSQSPFLLKMIKSIIDGSYCFLIMEYCSGGDLESIIKSKRKLPPSVLSFLF
jgi:serine/threonine protein kinase